MRRTLLAVLVAAGLTACGSSSSASDPTAACKNVFTTLCNKLFQCDPSAAAQAYGSAANCATNLSGSCTSANTACPNGKSYNASNASQCISDYGNESCTDITSGVTPTSCSNVCT
jgi:hypothetical protein